MPHTKRECFERTRLNFIVYLVDHHCSLSHGRPPMTRGLPSSIDARTFLQAELSTPKDLILVSHMELWSISYHIFDVFGADINSSFDKHRFAELQTFTKRLDEWQRDWIGILSIRGLLTKSLQNMLLFYYSSTKLYLFSHVFRGSAMGSSTFDFKDQNLNTVAGHAVEEALSIIRLISNGPQDGNQWKPENLPCYFCTATAFACILLLRASGQYQSLPNVNKDTVLQTLHQLATSVQASSLMLKPANSMLKIIKSLNLVINEREMEINSHHLMRSQATQPVNSSSLSSSLNFDLFGNDLFGLSFIDDQMDWLSLPGPTENNESGFLDSTV
jgi:hypothetical protein